MNATQQMPLFKSLSEETTLLAAIEPFQGFLRNEGKTLHTIKGFTSDLSLMCRYFGDEMTIGAIQTADLNRFLRWLEHERDAPCSQKSYARRVTTIKVFFKWLRLEKLRSDDPSLPIVQRSGPAPLQPVLSRDDIHKLLDYTTGLRGLEKPDPRPDLLVRLLLDTGVKKNECMELTAASVNNSDPAAPLLHVRTQTRQNVYKDRVLAISPAWLDVLDEYLAHYKPKSKIFTCTPRNLEYVLHDAAVGAGIESRISFEIMRWTCAVQDYLNGVDMDFLREKLGLSEVSWRETSSKIKQLAQQQNARR